MTLGISVTNPEGIVMAIESRQTYRGRVGARIGSDAATKIFELTNGVLAMTSGYAFLRPQGSQTFRSISSLVEDFKASLTSGIGVRNAADELHRHFLRLYAEHVAQVPNDAAAAGQVAISFLVGGYEAQSRVGTIFECSIPGTVVQRIDTDHPSTYWVGQWDVVARIVRGWDPRLVSLPSLQQVGPNLQQELVGLEYLINWHTMTLQDSVDFARSMIEITIAIQRFTDGLLTNPGDVPGVGGPIDIALVRPNGALSWVQQKQLHA